MKNVLVTTSSFCKEDPAPLSEIESAGLIAILNPFGRKLTEGKAIDLIKKYDPVGIIAGVEPLTRKVLEEGKNLKVVSRCGIGMDSVDLVASKDLGITVTNTPDAPTIPVAELTMCMILSLLRKIHVSDASIRSGAWERPMGNLLHGKTVGIIGCGRIGSFLGRLLAPFDCTLFGYDPYCQQSDLFQLVSLEDLLIQSDIVTLHLPFTEENRHFINVDRLGKMKQNAFLINAARGGLVDEDALYDALSSGTIAGAALDCFEKEPYKGRLRDLDNTLLTGHIGSYAREGRIMMEAQAVENLIRELKSRGVIS